MTKWHVSGPLMLNACTCTCLAKLAEGGFPSMNVSIADWSMEIQHFIGNTLLILINMLKIAIFPYM